jgi:hypothetical protein
MYLLLPFCLTRALRQCSSPGLQLRHEQLQLLSPPAPFACRPGVTTGTSPLGKDSKLLQCRRTFSRGDRNVSRNFLSFSLGKFPLSMYRQHQQGGTSFSPVSLPVLAISAPVMHSVKELTIILSTIRAELPHKLACVTLVISSTIRDGIVKIMGKSIQPQRGVTYAACARRARPPPRAGSPGARALPSSFLQRPRRRCYRDAPRARAARRGHSPAGR